MMRALVGQPYTVVFAVLLGLVVAPLLSMGMHQLTALYDHAYPVVEMRGELVRLEPGEVVIRISGVKHRACTYLRLKAMVRDAHGNLSDAYIERIDRDEYGDTRAPGRYYLGEWRIWPRGGAVAVLVNANHLCVDRVVITKIADVPL